MRLNSDKIKMNLQFFAEPPVGATPVITDPRKPTDPVDPPGATKVEFNKEQQSEIDRLISKATQSAIEKNQTKTDALIAEKVKAAADKAAEYAKLTEAQKQQKLLEERENNVTAAENALKTSQLKVAVEQDLTKEGLPVSFADVLIKLEDAEAIKTVVNDLKVKLDEKANELVKERLRGTVPPNGATIKTSHATNSDPIAAMAAKHRLIGKD